MTLSHLSSLFFLLLPLPEQGLSLNKLSQLLLNVYPHEAQVTTSGPGPLLLPFIHHTQQVQSGVGS